MNLFKDISQNGVLFAVSENIPFTHCFSTRQGGVSRGFLSSMNFSEERGDDAENIAENRRRLFAAAGFENLPLITGRQSHTVNIAEVSAVDADKSFEDTDGFITADPGVVIGVKTADCVPVLLAGENYVGAVHAGWRGSVGGILQRAIELFAKRGEEPSKIRAAIGPCIHSCCFEVKEDFIESVTGMRGVAFAEKYIFKTGGGYYADLVRINTDTLLSSGVPEENISVSGFCTCCNPEKYFSHRATAGKRGTMLAVISKTQRN